jgi:two-component system, NtrC family, sensor kinase
MRTLLVFIWFTLLLHSAKAQGDSIKIFHISTIPSQGILLKGWLFHDGDVPAYANPDYNDQNWKSINPTLDIYDVPELWKRPVGWLRIHLRVDSTLLNKPLAFQVRQYLASEIYLNGVLVKKYGVVSFNSDSIKAYQPQYESFGVQFSSINQVVAIRFSFQTKLPYIGFVPPFHSFMLRINTIEGAAAYTKYDTRFYKFNLIEAALFLLLFLIHLSFFIVYPKQKANLFFALATLFSGIGNLLYVSVNTSHNVAFIAKGAIADWITLWTLYGLFLFLAIHTLFSSRRGLSFWAIIAVFLLGVPFLFISYKWGYNIGMLMPLLLGTAESFRISWLAYRKGKQEVGIVIAGLGSFFIFFSIFNLFLNGVLPNPPLGDVYTLMDLIYHLSVVSIPFSLSIYLSLQYALTTKNLEKKLLEVQQLSKRTLLQEQEKQQILASQKETLEQQVTERTAALQQSLQELKATQAQLVQSEKMASLGELTAGIAHEIQNPLNFVNNFSEVNKELLGELRQEVQAGKTEDALQLAENLEDNTEKISYHGRRAEAIVKSMLEHSRSSKGERQPTSLNALIDEYLRLAYHGFRAKDKTFNAAIQTNFDEAISTVNVVPQEIGRVLLNLFNNAFYAVHEQLKKLGEDYEPTVTVSTRKLDDKIEIEVQDNGMGISKSIQDKIFQPFFTTKPTGQGTGLGLSLSYDIVKAHSGELKVESKEGEGSNFSIVFPVQ